MSIVKIGKVFMFENVKKKIWNNALFYVPDG